MADKKISQLSGATTPLTGTEELAIVQGGSTVKATAQDVADLAGAPYSVYVAKLTFTNGTNLPTVTVFQNTIGNIVWSWWLPTPSSLLIGTLAGAFPNDKLFINTSVPDNSGTNPLFALYKNQDSEDSIGIQFLNFTADPSSPDFGDVIYLEIRVYP